MAECDESEQVQSESSACWELRQIIRDAPFPLKDQNDAAEELERLAEQSDLHAQYLMGLLSVSYTHLTLPTNREV